MAKRFIVPIILMLAFTLLASTVLAQVSPEEEEANQKRMAAEQLLNDLDARDFESQSARDSLEQAHTVYDEGMMAFMMGDWNASIERFDNAIYLGGEAMAYEEASDIDIGEVTGIDLPWGEGVDIEGIGQGVRSSDFNILLGIILVSVFIVLPVTYKLI